MAAGPHGTEVGPFRNELHCTTVTVDALRGATPCALHEFSLADEKACRRRADSHDFLIRRHLRMAGNRTAVVGWIAGRERISMAIRLTCPACQAHSASPRRARRPAGEMSELWRCVARAAAAPPHARASASAAACDTRPSSRRDRACRCRAPIPGFTRTRRLRQRRRSDPSRSRRTVAELVDRASRYAHAIVRWSTSTAVRRAVRRAARASTPRLGCCGWPLEAWPYCVVCRRIVLRDLHDQAIRRQYRRVSACR